MASSPKKKKLSASSIMTKEEDDNISISSSDDEEEEDFVDDDEPEWPALLSRLMDEMDHSIDVEDKSAYLRALEKAPELVAKESDPVNFLRATENFDAKTAAARLATYWKLRMALFGPERAWLPMISTGFGALSPEDVAVLKSGFFVSLPADRRGRAVMLLNHDHIANREADRCARFRCLFYLLQVTSENETSRSRGVVILRKGNRPNLDPARLGKIFALLRGHAIRFEGLYLLCQPRTAGEKRLWKETLIPAMRHAMPNEMGQRTRIILATSATSVTQEETPPLIREMKGDPILRSLRYDDGLPASLGGNWSYDEFDEWVDLRARYERGLYEVKYRIMLRKKATIMVGLSDDKPETTTTNAAAPPPPPPPPPAVHPPVMAISVPAPPPPPSSPLHAATSAAGGAADFAPDAPQPATSTTPTTTRMRMMTTTPQSPVAASSSSSINSEEDDTCSSSFSSYDSGLERTLQSAEAMIAQFYNNDNNKRQKRYHHYK